ncbi:MAG TPA: carbohydrate-binding protein [Actinocrinis sp.]|nr:carbohydrate-binding protein [Actinocrinis sp.]
MNRGCLRRRGAVLVVGAIAAAGLTAAVTVPAFGASVAVGTDAGSDLGVNVALSVNVASAADQGASAAAQFPSASAPTSAAAVDGAVYGSAAVARAGSAAEDFLTSHQQVLNATAKAGAATPLASQLHYWWGSFPVADSGAGGMATQSIDPNFRLTDSTDVLYAPTMKPADGSCIEVVTVHTTAAPQVWAWDWCNSLAPGAEVTVDGMFLAKYTSTVNGRTVYTQKNVLTNKAGNTWTTYLYNYRTSSWDTLFSSSGTDHSGLTYGWDMFEFYSSTNPSTGNTYVCDDIARAGLVVESSNLQIETGNNVWTLANANNSSWQPSARPSPSAYKCPSMLFTIVSNSSDWTVSEG